jgi:hypothetical protein
MSLIKLRFDISNLLSTSQNPRRFCARDFCFMTGPGLHGRRLKAKRPQTCQRQVKGFFFELYSSEDHLNNPLSAARKQTKGL